MFQIGWRRCAEPITNIYNKLLYASTCTCNLVLCQDYNSREEFYECIRICIENSNDFSESGYRRITQLMETVDQNDVNANTNEWESYDNRSVIDLTNTTDVSNEVENIDREGEAIVQDELVNFNIQESVYNQDNNKRRSRRLAVKGRKNYGSKRRGGSLRRRGGLKKKKHS